MKVHRIALLLALSTLACQSTTGGETVSGLFKSGDFEGAYALAQIEAADAPDDAYYANVERMARVAILMDEGRDAALHGELAESLETFLEAENLAPGHPVIAGWLEKVVADLYTNSMRGGGAAMMDGDLAMAKNLYSRALVFNASQGAPKIGLARVLLLENYRKGLSDKYYKEGVRSLREYWLGQAGADFAAVEKYDPTDKRGRFRSWQVARLLAEERVLMANDLEEDELFHAARNEYRIALLVDEKNEEAIDGLQRMDAEVAAIAKLGDGEMATIRGDFRGAKLALKEGRELTQAQGARFEKAVIDLNEKRWEKVYLAATDAEADGDFEHAVKLYDLLLQETSYYEDVVDRRQTAIDFIKLASRLYDEAQSAKSQGERRQKLEEINVFWPEYKNVAKMLRRMK